MKTIVIQIISDFDQLIKDYKERIENKEDIDETEMEMAIIALGRKIEKLKDGIKQEELGEEDEEWARRAELDAEGEKER